MKHFFSLLTAETVAATEAAQNGQNTFSDMAQTLDVVLLALLVLCGIYCIYTYFKLRRECYLFPNKVLYPGNCRPEDCVDVDGFIDFILPRVLISGLLLLACGAAYGLCTLVLKIDHVVLDIASMVVPVGIVIIYAVMQNKAYKRFW